jgi:hypothetical protein
MHQILVRRPAILTCFLPSNSRKMWTKSWQGDRIFLQVFLDPTPGKHASNPGEETSYPYMFSSIKLQENMDQILARRPDILTKFSSIQLQENMDEILARRPAILTSFLLSNSRQMWTKSWRGDRLSLQVFFYLTPGKCGPNPCEETN